MSHNLYYNTVTPLLLSVLKTLMVSKEFDGFRLVGGTALSLYKGHRESVDIDLFTDEAYGTVDFNAIDTFLHNQYEYVSGNTYSVIGMGKSYYIGRNEKDCVKLDLFYTDKFIEDVQLIDGIRLASVEEIIAMKMDVISRGGRKKDFWDLHDLVEDFSFEQMLALHEKRYPYMHNEELMKNNFSEFTKADEDFDPVCLRGKYWQIIKLDMIEFATGKK
ncbi:hypothetical protein BH11BAC7_BH11BAC7_31640 [soil metagenome]